MTLVFVLKLLEKSQEFIQQDGQKNTEVFKDNENNFKKDEK